jgi:hypothetical protein
VFGDYNSVNDFLDGYIGVKPPILSSPSPAGAGGIRSAGGRLGVYTYSFYGFDIWYYIAYITKDPYIFYSEDGWTTDKNERYYFSFPSHAFAKIKELEN